METESVNLVTVIEDVCRNVEVLAEDKNIEIKLAYMEPAEVIGDGHRLKQMVWTLLHNAVKYTPENGRIKITLQDLDDYAYLTVQDNGIGIPETDLPWIFDRFYRVDKARSRSEGGSGLGLSICKHIVDMHNGEIEVESEVGKGTRFKVRLPKQKAVKRKIA